jgi:hypothetical protein
MMVVASHMSDGKLAISGGGLSSFVFMKWR